jgi:hypothetical protein
MNVQVGIDVAVSTIALPQAKLVVAANGGPDRQDRDAGRDAAHLNGHAIVSKRSQGNGAG